MRQLINIAERAVLQARRGSGTIASLLMSDHEEMQPVMTTEGKPLKEYVEAFERMLIDNTMRRHKGSIASVMEELCLPRRTLNEKMAKYGFSGRIIFSPKRRKSGPFRTVARRGPGRAGARSAESGLRKGRRRS